jgi:hypothetical protein
MDTMQDEPMIKEHLNWAKEKLENKNE